MTAYYAACRHADSIREITSQACQVIEGSNDGYFIEAFGKSYRFASVDCPQEIAALFVAIVAMGPIHTV